MAGRPKMTEAQKEAAKKAREAAKADAVAGAAGKADKAEARAGAKPGNPPAAKLPQSTANTDDLDREEKALFLNHLPLVKKARDRMASSTADLRNLYKRAKAEGGFTKADLDTAIAVETAESEARERAAIARKLKIAKIMGSSLGAQLDMFLEPDRTPIADRAYAEGEKASMENKSGGASPPYDPSTEAYRQYMAGFHAHQATLAKGIKPTNPAVQEDVKATAEQKATVDQQKAQDAKTFDQEPNGGAEKAAGASQPPNPAMTRSQFKAQQEAAKGAGKPN